jgi:hypothetical protein
MSNLVDRFKALSRKGFLAKMALILAISSTAASCTSSPQVQTRVVPVPSSKPYRYIKPHPADALTENTMAQIERHNNVHWKVKEAEKKAAEQK